jgi:hypothetical protein
MTSLIDYRFHKNRISEEIEYCTAYCVMRAIIDILNDFGQTYMRVNISAHICTSTKFNDI